MKKIPVYSLAGEVIEEREIPEDILREEINKDVLYYYVVAYQANQRQGTVSTKTRGEVSGGGRKPWRQKGTGRARVGSIRNPIWRHGGVAFGPKPRDFSIRLPKKVKRKAVREAIRGKLKEDRVVFFKAEKMETPKTKIFAEFIKKLGYDGERVIFILSKDHGERKNITKSLRNIPLVEFDYSDQINAYEILKSDRVVVDINSFEKFVSYLGEQK